MKLNRIFASLAGVLILGGALVSCTDEVKFSETPAPDTDQVYFASNVATTLDIVKGETTLSVPVERYKAGDELTVQLKGEAVDKEGKHLEFFTFPTSVTFAKDAKEANIAISLDFSKVVAEEDYYLTIELQGDQLSPYGVTTGEFTAVYAPWTEWKRYGSNSEFGTGTLSLFSVANDELPVYYSESLEGAKKIKYQFGDYGCPELEEDENKWAYLCNGVNATITVFEEEVYTSQATGKQYYACSFSALDIPNGDTGTYLSFLDVYTYLKDVNPGAADNNQTIIDSWRGGCLYDPETGVFNLQLMAYGSAIGDGKFMDCEETFSLPGFKSYYINFNHVGNIVDVTGSETVILQALKSEDLDSYAYKVVPGTLGDEDIKNAVAEIEAEEEPTLIRDTEYYISYTPEEEGDYTLVAVGYDEKNEKVYDTYFNFTFSTVQAASEWEKLGEAIYTDGFLYPFYGGQIGGETWNVDVEQHKTTPGRYRIVNPYRSGIWPNGYEGWDLPGKHYIVVNAENPEAVYLEQTELGIELSPNDGAISVWSMAGLYVENGNDLQDVADAGYCGKLEDGVITFPGLTLLMRFASDKEGNWRYTNPDPDIDMYIYGPDGQPTAYDFAGQMEGTGLFMLDLNGLDVAKAPAIKAPLRNAPAVLNAELKYDARVQAKTVRKALTQKEIKNHFFGKDGFIRSNVKTVIK